MPQCDLTEQIEVLQERGVLGRLYNLNYGYGNKNLGLVYFGSLSITVASTNTLCVQFKTHFPITVVAAIVFAAFRRGKD